MNNKESGITLVEFIIVAGVVTLIFTLVYLPYRSSYQSYHRSNIEVNLQQNAHIAMKKIVKELGAGMIVIPEDSEDGKDGTINYGYIKSSPYKIAIYTSGSPPESRGDRIALYVALPEDDTTPQDPTSASTGERPLLYKRGGDTSSWEDPASLIRKEENLKITQLNFIVGGDNEGKVIITLELAQEEPISQRWYTYKLVSGAKLGAR